MVLRSIVLAAALLAASSLAADRLLLSSEADLTWKYRVLLLAGDNSGDRIAILRAHRKAIEERDLIWFLALPYFALAAAGRQGRRRETRDR